MRSVVITGASSGLGRALALHYARQRCTLGLLGRDEPRLAAVAAACRELGARVSTGAIDVRSREAMAAWLEDFDNGAPVDLLIANAGVMEGRQAGAQIEAADAGYALMQTNVLGVINTVQPLLPAMIARGRGQIAIISSIAAFVPLPDAPSYSASKAAGLQYGLSLRAQLADLGIRVNVVCPGYITTPMTLRESGAKPSEMSPERAADLIGRRLEGDRAVIVLPFWFGLATRISGLLPDRLQRWIGRPFRFTVSDS